MINFFDLLALGLGIMAIAIVSSRRLHRLQQGLITATVVTVLMTAWASPAIAAAANDAVLSEGQQELHETLRKSPTGNQYSGIEYPQSTGEPTSDRELITQVQQSVPGDVKLSVSNGSVRLSGQVGSLDEAKRIVQDVKEIPGIHEVSYDLGVNS